MNLAAITTDIESADYVTPVKATLTQITDTSHLANEWRELEQHADASFFISWGWIGPWLQMALNANIELYLYRCTQADTTIALAILSRTKITRRKIFRSTVLALNEVARNGLDMIIEYNDVLIRRNFEKGIRCRFLLDLLDSPVKWDELMLSGIPESSWQEIAEGGSSLTPLIDEERHPWSKDIDTVGGNLDTLLAPLSRNRRWQIRRSIKAFQVDGELATTAARSSTEALSFFDAMGVLHTARWNSVGQAGSFANPHWVALQRAIIREGFDRNEIQMLKISTGEKTIGYIYSFIWRKTAYMLQSGFTQEIDNTRRPGIVSHVLAMQYNSNHEVSTYDFMCGDAEYKQTLGTAMPLLLWGRLQRNRMKLLLEKYVVAIFRTLN